MCWDRGQENVDGDHGQATHANDDLGRYSGDEPCGEEGIRTANDSQRQVLDSNFDEAVAADRLHVYVHIPKIDTQTHEGEENGEHENSERRRLPNVKR